MKETDKKTDNEKKIYCKNERKRPPLKDIPLTKQN